MSIQANPAENVPANYPPVHWGRVKWYDAVKKFGFISGLCSANQPEDLFVHFSELSSRKGHPAVLYTGEYVEYRVLDANDESQQAKAVNVTGIGGGPLLCHNGKIIFQEYYRPSFKQGEEEKENADAPASL